MGSQELYAAKFCHNPRDDYESDAPVTSTLGPVSCWGSGCKKKHKGDIFLLTFGDRSRMLLSNGNQWDLGGTRMLADRAIGHRMAQRGESVATTQTVHVLSDGLHTITWERRARISLGYHGVTAAISSAISIVGEG